MRIKDVGRRTRRVLAGALAVLALAAAAVVAPAGPASAASSWLQVSGGNRFTCGIKADHSLWCWGVNNDGQLGQGDRVTRWTPVQVGTATNWRQVSTGNATTCATTTGNALFCWGDGREGQLGIGDDVVNLTPVRIANLGDFWASVSVGAYHTCAIRQSGILFAASGLLCWGGNYDGQIGTATLGDHVSKPTAISSLAWTSVTAGYAHTCGISVAGQPYCWGANDQGQLGLGDTIPRAVPTMVSDAVWTDLHAGQSFTCGVDSGGSTQCWGTNGWSQLGTGDTDRRLQPTTIGTGYSTVVPGGTTTCGIEAAQVLCWGDNGYGQNGIPNSGVVTTPQPVLTLPPTVSLSSGLTHECAVLLDGSLWCWGDGLYGQLGSGTHYPSVTPVQVTG